MKTIWILLLFLMAAPAVARAQNCDCTIAPFTPEPPCKAICKKRLDTIRTGSALELQLFVGLDKDVALRIEGWSGREKAVTLKDYEQVLKADEIKAVKKKLDSLGDQQLDYFAKPVSDRAKIRSGLNQLLGSG